MSVVQRYTDFRSIFADGGVDPEADQARGFMVQDGLTVLSKGQEVPHP